MDENMKLLLLKIDEKLEKQAEIITYAVTKNIMEAMDEKMKSVIEENNKLKSKIIELEDKFKAVDKGRRKNNLVFYGVEEKKKIETELVDYIKEIIEDMGIHIESQEISSIYRIGKKSDNGNRPIVVSITTQWKKHLILKNKTNLPPGINIKEDFSKEVLEKRKLLQPRLEEEKNKGNIAFLRYDQLIVKEPKKGRTEEKEENREKRKRENTKSPMSPKQKKSHTMFTRKKSSQSLPDNTKHIVGPSILNYVERTRTEEKPSTSKN